MHVLLTFPSLFTLCIFPAMELNKLIIIRSQSNITPKCVPLCVCGLTCYIRTHSISIFTLLELIIIDTSSEQLNAKYLFSLAIPVEKGSNAILTLYFELPKSIEFNITLTNLPMCPSPTRRSLCHFPYSKGYAIQK